MTDSVSMEPDGYVLFENEYYTADQLDAECKTDDAARFTLAQLQAAEQKGRREALEAAYNAMFNAKGCRVCRFDAQTAIRNLRDKP